MSVQGVVLLDLFGVVLSWLIINMVRTRKLHPAFAVIWLLATALMILIISVPPLMMGVTRAVGATYPASAMTLLAFALVFGMLIFFSMQLSILSARQVEMAQKIALYELAEQERKLADSDQKSET